ncbi:hypothetical protein LTR94_033485, partial [Friedmanniomyces endolithicus]
RRPTGHAAHRRLPAGRRLRHRRDHGPVPPGRRAGLVGPACDLHGRRLGGRGRPGGPGGRNRARRPPAVMRRRGLELAGPVDGRMERPDLPGACDVQPAGRQAPQGRPCPAHRKGL